MTPKGSHTLLRHIHVTSDTDCIIRESIAFPSRAYTQGASAVSTKQRLRSRTKLKHAGTGFDNARSTVAIVQCSRSPPQ